MHLLVLIFLCKSEEIPAGAEKYCVTRPDCGRNEHLWEASMHFKGDAKKLLLFSSFTERSILFEIEYVLSERCNQDLLEIFFDQQRSRGYRDDNPFMKQCLENVQALVIQKSLACSGSSNITKKRKSMGSLSPLSRPLPKCKCKQLNFN